MSKIFVNHEYSIVEEIPDSFCTDVKKRESSEQASLEDKQVNELG